MKINEIIFWLIIFFCVAPRCVLIIAFYHEYLYERRTKSELYSSAIMMLLFSEFLMLYIVFSFLECIFAIISNKIEKLFLFIKEKIRKSLERFLQR